MLNYVMLNFPFCNFCLKLLSPFLASFFNLPSIDYTNFSRILLFLSKDSLQSFYHRSFIHIARLNFIFYNFSYYFFSFARIHDKNYYSQVRTKGRRWWDTVSLSQQLEIQRVFGRMPDTEEDWPRLPDGPSWTWWLLAILPLGPQLQVGIVGTTSLEKRLRAIEKTLDHMEQRQLTVAPATSEETTTSSSICRDEGGLTDTTVSLVQ